MLGLTALLLMSWNTEFDLVAEASCIPEALYAQAEARKPFNPDGPIRTCRQRFGWTDAETDMAVATAKAMGEAVDDRQIAIKAGATEAELDGLFDSLRDEDLAKLGRFGQHFTPSELTDHNSARRTIGGLVSSRNFSANAGVRVQIALISRGILLNTNREFRALRLKRG